jgi:outer membrane receptor protein involved in Fe transport
MIDRFITRRLRYRLDCWRAAQPLALLALCAGAQADPQAPPSDAAPLESVVVSTRKLPVQTLIDRKVYDVSADVQSSFGTLSDVLSAIPSVDVDPDGNLTLRGDSNVLILVDGKPSALFSGSKAGDNLQSFPASEIERIEVLTTPPPQYKADGAGGVINIITRKKKAREGIAGSLQASSGDGGRSVVAADATFRAGALTAGVTAGFRRDFRDRLLESDVRSPVAPPGQVQESQSVLSEHADRNVPTASARAEFTLSERQSVSASFSWQERGGLRTYTQQNMTTDASGNIVGDSRRTSRGHDPEVQYDERLSYTSKLDRPGEELDISLHHSSSQQRERYDYVSDVFVPAALSSFTYLILNEEHAASDLAVDYVLPVSKARLLKLGYLFEQDDFIYGNTGGSVDYLYGNTGGSAAEVTAIETIDPNVTNDFKFRQRIHAIYASYQVSAGPWNVLGGVRAEETFTDALLLSTNAGSAGSYFGLFPSLHVDRMLSASSTLSLGASRRVSRPDPSNLDPYVDHEYAPNLTSGNVYLQPEYTQSYELAYGVQGHGAAYQLTGYYRRNRDSVTTVTQYLDAGVSLTTKENLPRDAAMGLELTTDGHLSSQISYGLSADLFHSQIDATALGTPGLQSTTGVNAKLKLDYRPTQRDIAQVSVTRTDRRLTPQGYISAVNVVNAGWRHQLRTDLTALGTVSDIFNGQRTERVLSAPGFEGNYLRAVRGRIFFVGVVYSFGTAPGSKQPAFQYEQP